jgi:hypothetical protein
MYGHNRLEFVSHKTFQASVIKHSSVLDPFISYEENEVLRMRSQVIRWQRGYGGWGEAAHQVKML